MGWAEDYRQDWIAETIRVFGSIRRLHLERKFGVSTPTASSDLGRFQRERPGKITYDTFRKCYIASASPDDKPLMVME